MHRRPLLTGGLATLALTTMTSNPLADRLAYAGPILDSHIHLFDPTRPQGIPWPAPEDAIHGRVLPDDYFERAGPFGVTRAIVVEASPWREDNFWLLDTIRPDPRMAGMVGNLELGQSSFSEDFKRLSSEPLFLGTRYGNLWERDLGDALQKPLFISHLKAIAEHQRVLDSANPNPRLIASLLRLSDRIPELQIVIDHLPGAEVPTAQVPAWRHDLAELAQRPQVAMKLSAIPRALQPGQAVRFELAYHLERLESLWTLFGEDRILFATDWPNSEHLGSLAQITQLSFEYLASQSEAIQRKVLHDNGQRIYRCPPPEQ